MGASCPWLVVQGGIILKKMFGVKSPEGNCPGGSFMEVNSLGGNYPGVTVWRAKVREVSFFGGYLIGGSCPGKVVQGKYSGVIVWGEEVQGEIALRGHCPVRNVRVP